jgi:phospholipid transport system transporter-binding protein
MMKAHAYCEGNQCFVTGDLDFSTVEKLWKESLPLLAQLREIKFDLSKVTSANSAGITLLIEWLKYADREKKSVSFANIPATIMSLAAISGVDKFFTIV